MFPHRPNITREAQKYFRERQTVCLVVYLIAVAWLRLHIIQCLIGLLGVIISGHADLNKQTTKKRKQKRAILDDTKTDQWIFSSSFPKESCSLLSMCSAYPCTGTYPLWYPRIQQQ